MPNKLKPRTPWRRMTQQRSAASIDLSPRQQEVLSLIAHGLTNREIAEKLGLSVRTVEVHRYNLMRRLDVRTVAQLMRQAVAHRLIRMF